MINLLIQDTTFTSNQGSDNGGSFIIGKNLWLNIHITGWTFDGNIYSNHLIGDIYKFRVSSTAYRNIDPTKVSGITASVLHKSHDYILEYETVTIQCSFTGVTSSTLQTSLSTSDSSIFIKQTPFVLAGTGTNTFTKLDVSDCIGMNQGGIFNLQAGSLTNTNSTYDGIIAYQGGAYMISDSLSVTTSTIIYRNSFTHTGGFVYCPNS